MNQHVHENEYKMSMNGEKKQRSPLHLSIFLLPYASSHAHFVLIPFLLLLPGKPHEFWRALPPLN